MKKNISIISIIIFIIIIVVGTIVYSYKNKSKQENLLKEEISKINPNEEIDMSIKTNGNYAKIEKIRKENFKEISDRSKKLNDLYQNEDIVNAISIENYEKDGPDFTNTKQLITNTKKEINENVDELEKCFKKENLDKKIEEKNLSEYYKDLYNSLEVNKEENFKESEKDIQTIKDSNTKYVLLLDNIEKILNYLSDNKDKWSIENGEFKYTSEEFFKQYTSLINELG